MEAKTKVAENWVMAQFEFGAEKKLLFWQSKIRRVPKGVNHELD
jgi:hypothetical protein